MAMTAPARLEPYQGFVRHSRRDPCPICGKPDWCRSFPDGATECMRTESPIQCVSGGWMHWPEGESPQDWRDRLAALPPPLPLPEIDNDLCTAVYTTILDMCPLAPVDRADLQRRGFAEEQIARHAYGSWPDDPSDQRRIVDAVIATHGEEIVGKVPGFYRDERGQPALVCCPGRLQRVMRDGRVIRLKVRRRNATGGNKFLHVSSNSKPGSVVAPATVHEAIPPGYAGTSTRIGFVEGIDKANMAADRFRFLVIAVASLGSTSDIVAAMEKHGAVEAVMLFDMDRLTNPQVRDHEQNTVDHLQFHGFTVLRAYWPPEHKGIDDALAAGVLPVLEPVVLPATESGSSSAKVQEMQRQLDELRRCYDELRELQSATMAALRNSELNPAERITAINLLMNQAAAAEHNPSEIEHHIPVARIAQQSGLSESTTATAIKTIEKMLVVRSAYPNASPAPVELFDRKVKWSRVDQRTGELRDRKETFYRPKFERLSEGLRLIAKAEKVEKRAHGGKRTECPDHPGAGVIVEWTKVCAHPGCGRVLDRGETIQPPQHSLEAGDFEGFDPVSESGVNEQDAGLVSTIAPVTYLRTRISTTFHNDSSDAEAERALRAWHGTPALPNRSRGQPIEALVPF